MQVLKDCHPSFLRFPGGCVVEGDETFENFYRWRGTVGPLEKRRQIANTWGYLQSYGVGFYEYFCLCEDLHMAPLPVVHCGLLCQIRVGEQRGEGYRRLMPGRRQAFYGGSEKGDAEAADFVFATFDTIRREEHLSRFRKDEFDMVVIDEVHRVGENHYQDIIGHFEPSFLLGMSATPDRSDGYDLYGLFDNDIILEIDRMQENLLSSIATENISMRGCELYLNFLQFARELVNRYSIVAVLQHELNDLCDRAKSDDKTDGKPDLKADKPVSHSGPQNILRALHVTGFGKKS